MPVKRLETTTSTIPKKRLGQVNTAPNGNMLQSVTLTFMNKQGFASIMNAFKCPPLISLGRYASLFATTRLSGLGRTHSISAPIFLTCSFAALFLRDFCKKLEQSSVKHLSKKRASRYVVQMHSGRSAYSDSYSSP